MYTLNYCRVPPRSRIFTSARKVHCAHIQSPEIPFLSCSGIILSGSPYSVYDAGSPHVDPDVFDLGVPILGICYGLQVAIFAIAS
jgi:GMP synthase-like glutamine amidotransferase